MRSTIILNIDQLMMLKIERGSAAVVKKRKDKFKKTRDPGPNLLQTSPQSDPKPFVCSFGALS